MQTTPIDIHHELIARSAKGDRGAFQELYTLYGGAMYGTALRILGSEQEAQDVIHDVFVELFEKIDKYQGKSTFGYWLKRVVINKSLNVLRKMKKEGDITNEQVLAENHETEEQPWWIRFSIADIQDAMTELAEGYRTIATLFLFEEYSHEEIANVLGISVATSRSQLSRAKQKLRTILSERSI